MLYSLPKFNIPPPSSPSLSPFTDFDAFLLHADMDIPLDSACRLSDYQCKNQVSNTIEQTSSFILEQCEHKVLDNCSLHANQSSNFYMY